MHAYRRTYTITEETERNKKKKKGIEKEKTWKTSDTYNTSCNMHADMTQIQGQNAYIYRYAQKENALRHIHLHR